MKPPEFQAISATQTATGLPACYALDTFGRIWFASGGAEGVWRQVDKFLNTDVEVK